MTAPLLLLENIAKSYGPRAVFRNVSLKLWPGETLFLSGPNGSGKSTLLKIIAGLSDPGAGRVSLNLPPGAQIGYLAHQTFLYPQLTARENLLFWSRLYQAPATEEQLRDALARVGLERLACEKAGILSRGQAQRLSLARLLLLKPALLLLDEPDSGLDEAARALLERESAAATARGAAVIWVSHYRSAPASEAQTRYAALVPAQKNAQGPGLRFEEHPARSGAGAPC